MTENGPSDGEGELARLEALTADPYLAALERDIRAQVEDLGFERFMYCVIWPTSGARELTFVTNYSADWMRRHIRNKYVSHDLVAVHAAQTKRPFLWTEIQDNRHLTKPQAKVFDEAKTFGLRCGGALPQRDALSGHSCLSVSTATSNADFAKLFAARLPALQLIAKDASQKIRMFQIQDRNRNMTQILTPHELEALMFAGRGLTRQQIATAMQRSVHTVKDQLESAVGKLGARNTTHAVSLALQAGLIWP